MIYPGGSRVAARRRNRTTTLGAFLFYHNLIWIILANPSRSIRKVMVLTWSSGRSHQNAAPLMHRRIPIVRGENLVAQVLHIFQREVRNQALRHQLLYLPKALRHTLSVDASPVVPHNVGQPHLATSPYERIATEKTSILRREGRRPLVCRTI